MDFSKFKMTFIDIVETVCKWPLRYKPSEVTEVSPEMFARAIVRRGLKPVPRERWAKSSVLAATI